MREKKSCCGFPALFSSAGVTDLPDSHSQERSRQPLPVTVEPRTCSCFFVSFTQPHFHIFLFALVYQKQRGQWPRTLLLPLKVLYSSKAPTFFCDECKKTNYRSYQLAEGSRKRHETFFNRKFFFLRCIHKQQAKPTTSRKKLTISTNWKEAAEETNKLFSLQFGFLGNTCKEDVRKSNHFRIKNNFCGS